jgi:isocitrate dehydrogenase (NAD+)
MNPKKVTLIPGDLAEHNLVHPILDLLAIAGARIEWETFGASPNPAEAARDALSEDCLRSIRTNGVALRGPFSDPAGQRLNPAVVLRKELGLYAGVRHAETVPGIPGRYKDIDLYVIRENTEDVYAGLEHEVHPGVVESIKVVSKAASERIFRFAFRFAREHGRRQVTIVHKANIMKQADGLFLKTGLEMAAEYPDIETRGLIVDNTSMQLVQNPHQFDILVCGNLYGDIIGDLCAGIAGGASALWGVDYGDDCAVFSMTHDRPSLLEHPDQVNPLPIVMPAIQLLKRIGQFEAAEHLRKAIQTTLVESDALTPDLGGNASTTEMLKALEQALRNL